jgi:hypothetical protein
VGRGQHVAEGTYPSEKEVVMTLRKSPTYRMGVVFWLSLSLAAQVLSTFTTLSASAGPNPSPQNSSQPRADVKRDMDNMIRQRNMEEARDSQLNGQTTNSGRRDRALVKANFERLKHDTDELADLAKSLQQELNKSNDHLLSLDVIDKAGKMEKLAKKIKGSAKGI